VHPVLALDYRDLLVAVGQATLDTFKLASGVKTVAEMLSVDLWSDREPVYPRGWNTNVQSRRASWRNPRRSGTFYKPFETRRRALDGTLKAFGLGSAAWAFEYMINEHIRKLEDEFWSGAEYGTVTMQMPATEAGLTRLISVTGYVYRPTLDETMEYRSGAPNGYSNVVLNFRSLTEVS
jgi:hypothetical protein